MEKYIVWYSDENNKNKFSREFTLDELISQNHLDEVSDSPLLRNFKIDSINKGIGLKDIEGKNIYSNSSIVELLISEDFSNDHFSSTEEHKFIGIVKFDYFGARVEDLKDRTTIWFNEIENEEIEVKIIDTLQENKLGLIKIKNIKGEN